MNKMTIEEFKTESYMELLSKLIKINNGYITSKQVTELGIHRMYLNIMLNKGMIEKVAKGIYIDKNLVEDVFFTFQLQYPKIIYARFTALYLYNLTEIYPSSFDITVDYNYHVDKINAEHSVIKCKNDNLHLGEITTVTPLGNEVRAYDRERCICDIIRFKNKLDLEQVKKSVKMYINSKEKDLQKLRDYAKQLKIYEEVMNFVGMYYE